MTGSYKMVDMNDVLKILREPFSSILYCINLNPIPNCFSFCESQSQWQEPFFPATKQAFPSCQFTLNSTPFTNGKHNGVCKHFTALGLFVKFNVALPFQDKIYIKPLCNIFCKSFKILDIQKIRQRISAKILVK